jgi:hypothetical protein
VSVASGGGLRSMHYKACCAVGWRGAKTHTRSMLTCFAARCCVSCITHAHSYRLMVRRCMEGNRRFGMAQVGGWVTSNHTPKRLCNGRAAAAPGGVLDCCCPSPDTPDTVCVLCCLLVV